MAQSRVGRQLVSSTALLCAALAAIYVHGSVVGCAKGGASDSFGEEGESASSTSGMPSTGSGDTNDASSGAATTGGTSGDTSGGTTSGAPPSGGSCCVGGTTPGCADDAVAQCVCAQDDYCCTTEWNDECVSEVDAFGCGSCGTSGSTSGGNPGGACCTPSASPGCLDSTVEQCVCQQDDYCCSTEWNDLCVEEVDSFGCGFCGGSTSGGNPSDGECCFADPMPGCADPNVEQCVCDQDDYCCTVEWNDLCVEEVASFGCGFC